LCFGSLYGLKSDLTASRRAAKIARKRGKEMNVALMIIFGAVVLTVGYLTYGSLVCKWLGIDEKRPTPAQTMRDGVDYVPARMPVLLGHHFASIAGAGPIVGPVIAAAYGWLPAYLWILFGVIFIGAMLDLCALVASVRHDGKSIGEVIEHNVGRLGKRLFLSFSWFALILVIAAFTNVVATTFAKKPEVASASGLFILVAIVFGSLVYRRGVHLVPATVIGVFFIAASIWVGRQPWAQIDLTRDARVDSALRVLSAEKATQAERERARAAIVARAKELGVSTSDRRGVPLPADKLARVVKLELGKRRWRIPLLVYIFCASVAPVWFLLQPRDYLNSFLLYAVMIGGIFGAIFAHPELRMPAFVSFDVEVPGMLFPFLFVTVACGAISGFHSLVGSGTTSKQLANERDAKPVAYGGMLIEAMLAILAIASVAILTTKGYKTTMEEKGKILAFAHGVATFLQALHIDYDAAVAFVSLAISAFALTSLDTGTRLGRFAMQEFFEKGNAERKPLLARNRYIATAVTVIVSGLLAREGIDKIWGIFGSANQLLAALALMAVSVWLSRRGRGNIFTLVPMVFMFAVTLTALGALIRRNIVGARPNYLLAGIAGLLFVLAVILVVESGKFLLSRRKPDAEQPQS